MQAIIGYEGSLWLVAVLLLLAVGLTGALVRATRDNAPPAARERRSR
jgi:hypothetical protein